MHLFSKFAVLCSVGFVALYSMDNDETGVIPRASYFVYEGNEGNKSYVIMGVPSGSKQVTFYTYDGEAIRTTGYQLGNFQAVEKRLDPMAPKPQPVAYSIKYWECLIGVGYKGVPGHFIVFHDKHGNQIQRFRFEKNKTDVAEFNSQLRHPMDLSRLSFNDIDNRYAASQAIEKKAQEDHGQAKSGCSVL